MEGMTMTHTIGAALASSARREDDMLRRDFLKTPTATAVLTRQSWLSHFPSFP
jgi:hypothetical protein